MKPAAILSFVLLFAPGLNAQSDTASITGLVTDPAQAAMHQVNVAAKNAGTNITRTIRTNDEGLFTFTNLPPGQYELILELPGFRTHHETGIVLEIGQTFRTDIQMKVGNVSDSVNVKADVAPLNTENVVRSFKRY